MKIRASKTEMTLLSSATSEASEDQWEYSDCHLLGGLGISKRGALRASGQLLYYVVAPRRLLLICQVHVRTTKFPLTAEANRCVGSHGSSTQDTPAQDTPTQDTHARDTPIQDTPIQDTPTQDTPAQGTPIQDEPARDTPIQDTLSRDTPTQHTPAMGTPAQDPHAQETLTSF